MSIKAVILFPQTANREQRKNYKNYLVFSASAVQGPQLMFLLL